MKPKAVMLWSAQKWRWYKCIKFQVHLPSLDNKDK